MYSIIYFRGLTSVLKSTNCIVIRLVFIELEKRDIMISKASDLASDVSDVKRPSLKP